MLGTFEGKTRRRPLLHVLRRRRRLREGLVQLLAVSAGVALGVLLPRITSGPTVDGAAAAQLLIGLGAAIIPFIGIVFSLLFLVVQFGTTTWTPRLNLFRDSPLVWRSFAYFVGLMVWAASAALTVGGREEVSVVVPIVGVVGVIGALLVFRALQMEAFRSIQLAPTLAEITGRGRTVIDALYGEPFDPARASRAPLPEARREIRWPAHAGVLRQIHLPALVDAATRVDGIVELTVEVGDVVREGGVVAVLRGGAGDVDAPALLASFDVGLERTFDQDPRFAFRLLADIALRALSPAVNDQTTAVEVVDAIDSLLSRVSSRDLDVGWIRNAAGELQVVIPVPGWEEYVDLAIGDIVRAGAAVPPLLRRLGKLIDDITEAAPTARHNVLADWRERLESSPVRQ